MSPLDSIHITSNNNIELDQVDSYVMYGDKIVFGPNALEINVYPFLLNESKPSFLIKNETNLQAQKFLLFTCTSRSLKNPEIGTILKIKKKWPLKGVHRNINESSIKNDIIWEHVACLPEHSLNASSVFVFPLGDLWDMNGGTHMVQLSFFFFFAKME